MFNEISRSKKIIVMLGVMSAILLSALDQTIVATAMPKIVGELHGLEHLSFVFTAYLLASTVTIPIYGKLSDMYGRKRYYLFGIAVFILGSMLSGLSQNMTELIVFRALQGIGGGAMMTNSFAIIGDLFPPRERGKWQGLSGGVFAIAFVIGPMLGGFITDNISWRWNFYINVPVALVAFLLIGFFMPKIRFNFKVRKIDYQGAIALSIALVTLILGLVWGGNLYPWKSVQIMSLLITAVIFLILFLAIEQKAKEPIMPLALFRNPIFPISVTAIFLMATGMISAILYIPLFGQEVIGINATNSGTMLTPLMLALVSASALSGQIISRTGRYKLLANLGTFIAAASLYSLSLMGTSTTRTDLMIRMVGLGLGLGLTAPIFTIAVQNAFEYSKLGVATASVQLFRNIGSTVGVAITGSILNNTFSQKLVDLNGKHILAKSIGQIYLIVAILVGIAFVITFFLKEIPLRKSHKERPAIEEAGLELALEEGTFSASNEPIVGKKR